MVVIENSNTGRTVSRYEEPIPYTPRRKHRKQKAVVGRSVVGPRVVGAAEILILLVFAVEVVTLPFLTPAPTFVGVTAIGCCLSLPAMLAAWSAIRLGVWRYLLTVFLSLFNGFILTLFVSHKFDALLVMLPSASVLPVLLTLFVIKRAFGHFGLLERDADKFLEGLRFNLSHLFIVTTLLAILLPIGKSLWLMLAVDVEQSESIIVASLGALISFNTLMFVWALLGKQAILRTCIAIPIGVLTLVICIKVCCRSSSHVMEWYVLAGLPLVSSFVLMAAFRFSGWRFIRGTTS